MGSLILGPIGSDAISARPILETTLSTSGIFSINFWNSFSIASDSSNEVLGKPLEFDRFGEVAGEPILDVVLKRLHRHSGSAQRKGHQKQHDAENQHGAVAE